MRDEVSRRRGRGDRELDNLLDLKKMRGGYARSGRTDVQGLGQLDETDAERIRAPQKNRDLYADAGGLPLLSGGHQVFCLKKLTRH